MAFDAETQAFIEQEQQREEARRQQSLSWMQDNLSEYQLAELVRLMRDGERVHGNVSMAARQYARQCGDVVISRDEPQRFLSEANSLDLRCKGAKAKHAALRRVGHAMAEVQYAMRELDEVKELRG